jgi:hypothetical protein
VLASAAAGQWWWTVLATLSAGTAGVILAVAGAGFGDVRLRSSAASA